MRDGGVPARALGCGVGARGGGVEEERNGESVRVSGEPGTSTVVDGCAGIAVEKSPPWGRTKGQREGSEGEENKKA